jgi:type IV pilus assembly protein PilQ
MTRTRVTGLLVMAAVLLVGIALAQPSDAPPQLKGTQISEPPKGVALAQPSDAPPKLEGIKISELPSGVVVAIQTSAPTPYQSTLINSPDRIVIDMSGIYAAPKMRWESTPAPIREIRGSQWNAGTARLVVELTRRASYRMEEGATGLMLTVEPAPDAPAAGARSETGAVEAPWRTDPAGPTMAKERKATLDSAGSEKLDVGSTAAGGPEPDARPATALLTAAADVTPLGTATPTLPPRVAQTTPGSGQAAPAPEPQLRIQTTSDDSKHLTLDFKDADVINVLRLLAAEGGRNVAVGDDVKGKVSMSLHNVTWDQALDTILEARGLQKIEKGGIIRIVSAEQLAKERDARAKAEEAKRKAEIEVRTKMAEAQVKEQEAQHRRMAAEQAAANALARGPLKEEVVRLTYADAGEVANTLQGVLGLGQQPIKPCISVTAQVTEKGIETKVETGAGGGAIGGPIAEPPFSQLFGPPRQPEALPPGPPVSAEVVANRLAIRTHCPTNSLFLRLFAADLDRLKTLIREHLDVPLPQVKIEARMEILDRSALEAIGVQWGGAGAVNTGNATFLGQGFGQPNTGLGTAPNFNAANPNLTLTNPALQPPRGFLPVSPVTGLPEGGNLVNLPIGALANAATAVPTAGFAFGLVGSNFNINLALQALNEMGKTHTLARPEVVTVVNHLASISLGQQIPYATVSSAGTQIQFKDATLRLDVIPTTITERVAGRENTKIKMNVMVQNDDPGQNINLGVGVQVPAINTRRAETLVLLNEGERLVIGGVTQTVNSHDVRKVPVWGDIPVLGWLFKSKGDSGTGRELVIFVTPSVIKQMVASPVLGK